LVLVGQEIVPHKAVLELHHLFHLSPFWVVAVVEHQHLQLLQMV
jgi:hypothetical protein